MRYCLFIIFILHAISAGAQDAANKNSRVGFIAGPFLPSQIAGVNEILQVAGVRIGSNTKLGNFEGEGWIANGGGVSYQSFAVNYRLEIPSEIIPVHALAGIHADAYRKANATSASGGGWQLGGGVETRIAGPIMLGSDFEYRFGPGDSLLVLVSILCNF